MLCFSNTTGYVSIFVRVALHLQVTYTKVWRLYISVSNGLFEVVSVGISIG